MAETQWVQHLSGQGEKWRVKEFFNGKVLVHRSSAPEDGLFHLPESEYRPCDPPEPTWRDVTEACRLDEAGNIFHGSSCTMMFNGYRRRKVRLMEPSSTGGAFRWAFIVEQKVQP